MASQWNQDSADSIDSRSEISADIEVSALSSSDVDHLSQAKQAQAYVKNRVTSKADPAVYTCIANPFSGLSQASLAAIINDKSGLYTSYEKTAAGYESDDQTNTWVLKFQNDPQGQNAEFFQEAQGQYKLLSALQQSVYPIGYLDNLKLLESRESGAAVKAANFETSGSKAAASANIFAASDKLAAESSGTSPPSKASSSKSHAAASLTGARTHPAGKQNPSSSSSDSITPEGGSVASDPETTEDYQTLSNASTNKDGATIETLDATTTNELLSARKHPGSLLNTTA